VRRRGLALVAALAGLAIPAPALAGVEDTLGLGPRAMALGGSYAARPGDFAAVYYNPAGLSPGGTPDRSGGFFDLTAGWVYAHPSLHVTRADGSEIVTPGEPDTVGAVVGARFSVGQPFGIEGLNMGISAYVPNHLFRWSIYPDDDVQWALLMDRTQVVSAHTALAYRLTPWLSLGAGLRISFDVQTLTRGRVTSVEYDQTTGKVRTHTELGTDAQVYGRVTPLFGALITPNDHLRFGLTYKHASYVNDWGDTRIREVPILSNMGYTHHFAHYYEPMQLTAAAGVDVTPELDLSFDLTWARWSQALSTNNNTFGSGVWGDTWTPAVGARFAAAPGFRLLAGYRFQKSPLDNFGGPTNLLDNDRHVATVGLEAELSELVSKSLDASVTLAMEEILLVERTETKDFRRFPSDTAWQKNPGYPSYSHGGSVMALSLGLEARW
jgi:long-chain fatty acid transport protein